MLYGMHPPDASNLFGPQTRDELRRAYSEAWRKHLAGLPLVPLEAMLVDVIALHPAYQSVVQHLDAAIGFEPNPVNSTENPFLHMGLHMAVREQVAIDRPPGVRELHRRSRSRGCDVHSADHVLMDALSETLWNAQRTGQAPDESRYLALVRERVATR